MHRRLLESVLVVAVLLTSISAVAQDAWDKPLEGFPHIVFGERRDLGVLLVTPQTDEPTQAVEKLIKDAIMASGLAELVMDDAPLGDISQKSDEEILAAARKYPVDVIVLVRTFPGAEGPTATVWIESKDDGASNSYRMRPGGEPPWARRPPPNPVPSEDPAIVAASHAADFGRQEAAMTRMGAIGLAETVRLIAAERGRRILALEATKSPVVRDPDGDVVPWPEAYTLMDRADLAHKYRRRRVTRTAVMAAGGVVAAAGIGLLFVGLANQANCTDGGNCARPFFIGGGLATLGIGAAGVAIGTFIRPQPVSTPEIRALVDEHNATLR